MTLEPWHIKCITRQPISHSSLEQNSHRSVISFLAAGKSEGGAPSSWLKVCFSFFLPTVITFRFSEDGEGDYQYNFAFQSVHFSTENQPDAINCRFKNLFMIFKAFNLWQCGEWDMLTTRRETPSSSPFVYYSFGIHSISRRSMFKSMRCFRQNVNICKLKDFSSWILIDWDSYFCSRSAGTHAQVPIWHLDEFYEVQMLKEYHSVSVSAVYM